MLGLIKIFVIINLYFIPFVMVFSPLSHSPKKYAILNRNGTILCLRYHLPVDRDLLNRMNPQLYFHWVSVIKPYSPLVMENTKSIVVNIMAN